MEQAVVSVLPPVGADGVVPFVYPRDPGKCRIYSMNPMETLLEELLPYPRGSSSSLDLQGTGHF